MVGVCNYDRQIRASREDVWKVLTNCQKWRSIHALADWFGHVEWFQGDPWKVGSRILIEHYWPSRRDVRLVLVSFTPPEGFSWIGHDRGLTAHQDIRLEKIDDNTCRLTSTMSYAAAAGSSGPVAATTEVNPMADRILNTFLDAIAEHSEKSEVSARKAG